MPRSFQAIAAALALFVCAGFAAPERVAYTLTPIIRAGALEAVQIDLRFRGEADGETALALPDSWGGQDELWRGIADLTVVSGATLQPGEVAAARTLTHRPNARIHVRYRVIQDWQGPPMAGAGNPYRPIIQSNYFHLIGNAALVTPDNSNPLSPVRLNVRNMPRGWRFASDLEHQGATLGEAAASIIVGGDFRVVQTADPNIRIAMRGAQWRFTDADFAARVAEILAAQRRFWGDESTPFLVTLIELSAPNQGSLSIGGTGLSDSFAFFATPNVEPEALPRMLAHEGLHTWVPNRIGGLADIDEAAGYWFSEGFTEFYTGRILVRAGLWGPADFAADFNRTLREYAVSSARTAPNARILADFWRNRDLQQLPYQRGRMLATLWDVRLRAQGRDMDDVVHEMRARAAAGDPLNAAAMFPIVAGHFGLDVSADMAALVEHGGDVQLPADLLAPCGRIESREIALFHRGFDIDATNANNNIIAGVIPSAPAYAAGLRDGMVLLRRDGGEIGNADVEIAYVVRDGDTERTIRYMPRDEGHVTLQQLRLNESLAGEQLAQCVALLGGG
jgi:predicted metalloprotease with PDZ domain